MVQGYIFAMCCYYSHYRDHYNALRKEQIGQEGEVKEGADECKQDEGGNARMSSRGVAPSGGEFDEPLLAAATER